MSVCNLLKNGININQDWEIDYCCEMTNDGYVRPVFNDYDTFFKYRQPLYEQSKTKWIRGCEGCKHSEEVKNTSLRTFQNKRQEKLQISDDDYHIHHATLNLDNTCNLACRMCGTGASTKWQSYLRNAPEQQEWMSTYYNVPADVKQYQFEMLKKYVLTSHLDYIMLGGGEPTQIKMYMQMFNYLIENNMSQNIELHIHTNGTRNMDGDWGSAIEKFKEAQLVYSIDGTESNYEYIRTDSNWELVKSNIISTANRFQSNDNITCRVTYCFQALNAHKFKSDQEYFEKEL